MWLPAAFQFEIGEEAAEQQLCTKRKEPLIHRAISDDPVFLF